MPDTKISALPELSEVPADGDEFPFVDTSATTTKKMDAAWLKRFKMDAVVASGSITFRATQFVTLDLGTAIALTVSAAPVAGDVIVIRRLGSGAVTHTVQLPSGVTFDGTNRTANFDVDNDTLIAIATSATRFQEIYNSGVTYSA